MRLWLLRSYNALARANRGRHAKKSANSVRDIPAEDSEGKKYYRYLNYFGHFDVRFRKPLVFRITIWVHRAH